jgi:hypothetical protein
MALNLTPPDISELKPRITVFGVGGAGGNAVNNMITAGLQGVDFVVANTDAQALTMSKAQRIVQMGTQVTQGLGAGSQPDVGAAREVDDDLVAVPVGGVQPATVRGKQQPHRCSPDGHMFERGRGGAELLQGHDGDRPRTGIRDRCTLLVGGNGHHVRKFLIESDPNAVG